MRNKLSAMLLVLVAACATSSGWQKEDTVRAMRVGRTVVAAELQRAVDNGKIEPVVKEAVLLVVDAAIDAYEANDDETKEAVLRKAVWDTIDRVAELLAARDAVQESSTVKDWLKDKSSP